MNSATIQSQAGVIRDFVAHPGMKLLIERLKSKVASSEHAWISAKTPEEAEKIRQEARSYGTLMGILNEFLLKAKVDTTNSQSENAVE